MFGTGDLVIFMILFFPSSEKRPNLQFRGWAFFQLGFLNKVEGDLMPVFYDLGTGDLEIFEQMKDFRYRGLRDF